MLNNRFTQVLFLGAAIGIHNKRNQTESNNVNSL